MRKLFKYLLVSANIVAALLLLAAYVSTRISPEKMPLLAFFGIAYGSILVINAAFVVWWLFVRRKYALISGLAILIGIGHLNAYFQVIPSANNAETGAKGIRIISHNVRLFGWYNWKTNKKDRDAILDRLAAENPDVVCFQEYFHNSKPGIFEVNSLVKKQLSMPHLYVEHGLTVQQTQHYGMAIASKYPIVNKGKIRFPKERGNACIFADLLIGGDTIRVYNAHVASIRFSPANYRFVEDVQNKGTSRAPAEGLNIAERMLRAWKRRALHVDMIAAHMDQSPHPVVLCGDLNDTPVSYTYRQFSSRLNDSFRKGGWGIGNTYRGTFPSFRIDYIFYDKSLDAGGYFKLDEDVSDHHAVGCVVYLRR